MEAFTLHAEPSRTEPSLTERVPWLMFALPMTDYVAQYVAIFPGVEVRVFVQ
jgi:hypothetical protein